MKRILLGAAIGTMLWSAGVQAETIPQRRQNQQDRIAQGVRSGQLTARETARLENREAAIHREVRRDRALHDGHLTPVERARIQHQDNVTSREIYRDKHNGWRQ